MTIDMPEWMLNPPTTLKEKISLVKLKRGYLRAKGPKGKFIRNLFNEIEAEWKLIEEKAKEMNPLAYFKPSYEQSLILNSWMYGISFICVYSANRIGKTTACFLNILLWILPNNPKWQIFKPYKDHKGRLVQVFPRPDISAIKLIADAILKRPFDLAAPNPRFSHKHPQNQAILQHLQKVVPFAFRTCFPFSPWNKGGTVWFGGPDQEHHEQILMPLFRQYIPKAFLTRYTPSDREITLTITTTTGRMTCWELIGKSYESKDTKWSSGAVDAIFLTEGVKQETLKEIKLRFKDPGIGSHDFTPYLPANAGAASAVAQRIANGKEPLPLKYFVFTKFTVYDAPDHIISADKRRGLIESFENDPEGAARLSGEFYSSSALILEHLSRDLHLLPWTRKELFSRYPNARLFRGLDPGLDHPCVCAWGALLPTNQWIIYRIFSARGLSISERVKKIINLSNNTIGKVYFDRGPKDYYCVECHSTPRSEIISATVMDYHSFKTDEVTKTPFANHYITRGLSVIESNHTGPEERAQHLDDLLAPDQFTPHPITGVPPSPRVLFLKNEPGIMAAFLEWEELYWDRKKSGPNRGMPNDKIPEHGDDTLDGVCYLTNSNYRWTKEAPSARFVDDSEPEEHLIEQAMTISEAYRERPSHIYGSVLQPLQNKPVIFGDPNPSFLEEDD